MAFSFFVVDFLVILFSNLEISFPVVPFIMTTIFVES